jgi:hypothetical protein
VRTIGQRHRKENERAAESGNDHHPVDAQGWLARQQRTISARERGLPRVSGSRAHPNDPEAAILHLNTRGEYGASIPSDLTDYDPCAFLWDTPPLF